MVSIGDAKTIAGHGIDGLPVTRADPGYHGRHPRIEFDGAGRAFECFGDWLSRSRVRRVVRKGARLLYRPPVAGPTTGRARKRLAG